MAYLQRNAETPCPAGNDVPDGLNEKEKNERKENIGLKAPKTYEAPEVRQIRVTVRLAEEHAGTARIRCESLRQALRSRGVRR